MLDGSNNIRIPSDVSPDGKQIAYFSIGERQEDIFIGGDRRHGHAPYHRRCRARSRGGVHARRPVAGVLLDPRRQWAIWTIRVDGSNLRKLAGAGGGCVYPLASPLDDTVVFSGERRGTVSYGCPPPAASGETAAEAERPAGSSATSFSPDGTKLVGPA